MKITIELRITLFAFLFNKFIWLHESFWKRGLICDTVYMIIYKETVFQFIDDCRNDLIVAKISAQLKDKKGICVGSKEIESWRTTLRSLQKDFIYIIPNDKQYVLLEYLIPFSNKRIDVILVGANKETKNLSIIELKGWSDINLKLESKFMYPNVSYGPLEHPGYEALDYKSILENQFNDINKVFKLSAMAYLPNYQYKNMNPLLDKRYDDILKEIEVFCQNNKKDLILFLKKYFNECIDIKEVDYLNNLDYKPSKSFIEHLKNEFQEIKLISSQRVAFEKIKELIQLNDHTSKKTLFIISGSAGSGKTIVAFKLLSWLMAKQKLCNLMLPGVEFRNAVKKTFGKQVIANSRVCGAYAKTQSDYVIIDEAHKATANGTCKQFYNTLFNNVNNVIALIDDMQVINKKGFTKEQVKQEAISHKYAIYEMNLQEQFRSAGDATYIDWLRNWIFNDDNLQEFFVTDLLKFQVLEGKAFNSIYQQMYKSENIRMISFWTQTWDLDKLNAEGMPNATVHIADCMYTWNPNDQWLAQFKKNNPNISISTKLRNLCEVQNFIKVKKGYQYIAYFNTIQGSEFDYIFVHVPKLFYLNGENQLDVDLNQLVLREMKSQIWKIDNSKESANKNEKMKLNKVYFLNRLFIALTRGLKGVYVYFEDEKLSEFIRKKIKNS